MSNTLIFPPSYNTCLGPSKGAADKSYEVRDEPIRDPKIPRKLATLLVFQHGGVSRTKRQKIQVLGVFGGRVCDFVEIEPPSRV